MAGRDAPVCSSREIRVSRMCLTNRVNVECEISMCALQLFNSWIYRSVTKQSK